MRVGSGAAPRERERLLALLLVALVMLGVTPAAALLAAAAQPIHEPLDGPNAAMADVLKRRETLRIGGPVFLTETLVLEVHSSLPRYLRGQVFDTYAEGVWTKQPTTRRTLEVGQAITLDIPREAYRDTVKIVFREGFTDIIHTPTVPFRIMQLTTAASGVKLFFDGSTDLWASRRFSKGDAYVLEVFVPQPPVAKLRQSGTDYPQGIRDIYLQLPESLPVRVRELAENLTAPYDNPYDKVKALERYLRESGKYAYRQDVDSPPQGVDPVDHLLFTSREGYSALYASAMVLMSRAVGIPARLVTGFAPGQYDPQSGAFQVHLSDLHGWVEVYFSGIGWIEFEPTPSFGGAGSSRPAATSGSLPASVAEEIRANKIDAVRFLRILPLGRAAEVLGALWELDQRLALNVLERLMAEAPSTAKSIVAELAESDAEAALQLLDALSQEQREALQGSVGEILAFGGGSAAKALLTEFSDTSPKRAAELLRSLGAQDLKLAASALKSVAARDPQAASRILRALAEEDRPLSEALLNRLAELSPEAARGVLSGAVEEYQDRPQTGLPFSPYLHAGGSLRIGAALQDSSTFAVPRLKYYAQCDCYVLTAIEDVDDFALLKLKASKPYYLRAEAYEQYLGASWLRGAPDLRLLPKTPDSDPNASGAVQLRIKLLAPGGLSLPSPLHPVSADYGDRIVALDANQILKTQNPVDAGDEYTVAITDSPSVGLLPQYAPGSFGSLLPSQLRFRYLQLPENLPERVTALAQRLTEGLNSPGEKAAALQMHLQFSGLYEYSRKAEPTPEGRDAAEYFLFESRRGNAEHFASAMVVLSRAVGIPARMVVGFAPDPDSFSRESGEYVYRLSQAHAWAELFLPERGWTIFDPSPNGPYPAQPGRAPEPTGVEKSTRLSIEEYEETVLRGSQSFVAGWLVSEDGEPVGGVKVSLFLLNFTEGFHIFDAAVIAGFPIQEGLDLINSTKGQRKVKVGEGFTDPEGFFRIRYTAPSEHELFAPIKILAGRRGGLPAFTETAPLPLGSYRLIASFEGLGGLQPSEDTVNVNLKGRPQISLQAVNVGPSIRVFGHLLDDVGNPIPQAPVALKVEGANLPQPLSLESTTGGDGGFSFTLEALPPAVYTVTVSFPGDRLHAAAHRSAPLDTTRQSTETKILGAPNSVIVGEEFSVLGSVKTLEGGPAAGITVLLFLNKTKTSPGILVGDATTDAEGAFQARVRLPASSGVEPGVFQLVARSLDSEKYKGSSSDLEVRVVAKTRLSVSVTRVGQILTVAGTLVDHAGRPLAQRAILLQHDGQFPAPPRLGDNESYSPPYSHTGSVFELFTDEAGRVRVDLPATPEIHRITLTFTGSELYSKAVAQETVDLRLKSSLELEIEPDYTRLVGEELEARLRLIGAEKPIGNAEILLVGERGENVTTARTDSEGKTSVKFVAPRFEVGEQTVKAVFPGDLNFLPSEAAGKIFLYAETSLLIDAEIYSADAEGALKPSAPSAGGKTRLLSAGDEVKVRGILLSDVGPLAGQVVVLLANGEPVASTLTDLRGNFFFSWKLREGSGEYLVLQVVYESPTREFTSTGSNPIFFQIESRLNPTIPALLGVLGGGAGLSTLAYLHSRRRRRSGPEGRTAPKPPPRTPSLKPEKLEPRVAVIQAYTGAVELLEGSGLTVTKAMTHWELYRAVRRRLPDLAQPLLELTRLFQEACYGRRAAGPPEAQRAQAAYESLKEALRWRRRS